MRTLICFFCLFFTWHYEQGYHDGILQKSDVEAYTRGYHYASGDK